MGDGEISENGMNVQRIVEEHTIADIAFVTTRSLLMEEKIVQEMIRRQGDVINTRAQVSSLVL